MNVSELNGGMGTLSSLLDYSLGFLLGLPIRLISFLEICLKKKLDSS